MLLVAEQDPALTQAVDEALPQLGLEQDGLRVGDGVGVPGRRAHARLHAPRPRSGGRLTPGCLGVRSAGQRVAAGLC